MHVFLFKTGIAEYQVLLCADIFPAKKYMAIPSEKTFHNRQKRSQVIDEDKFRFDMFVLLIEEWLRRKLKVRTRYEITWVTHNLLGLNRWACL